MQGRNLTTGNQMTDLDMSARAGAASLLLLGATACSSTGGLGGDTRRRAGGGGGSQVSGTIQGVNTRTQQLGITQSQRSDGDAELRQQHTGRLPEPELSGDVTRVGRPGHCESRPLEQQHAITRIGSRSLNQSAVTAERRAISRHSRVLSAASTGRTGSSHEHQQLRHSDRVDALQCPVDGREPVQQPESRGFRAHSGVISSTTVGSSCGSSTRPHARSQASVPVPTALKRWRAAFGQCSIVADGICN